VQFECGEPIVALDHQSHRISSSMLNRIDQKIGHHLLKRVRIPISLEIAIGLAIDDAAGVFGLHLADHLMSDRPKCDGALVMGIGTPRRLRAKSRISLTMFVKRPLSFCITCCWLSPVQPMRRRQVQSRLSNCGGRRPESLKIGRGIYFLGLCNTQRLM
jgi:hypothetical protein